MVANRNLKPQTCVRGQKEGDVFWNFIGNGRVVTVGHGNGRQ